MRSRSEPHVVSPPMTRAEWRAARLAAYRAGAYVFRAPPVCTVRWNERDWCKFVRFTDRTLTGFDDGRE